MATQANKPAPKAKAEKPAEQKAPAKKAEPKKTASGAQLKITQVQGSIARKWDQEATLKGLGLGKRHRSRVLADTPEIRGMINKVQHLVRVEKA